MLLTSPVKPYEALASLARRQIMPTGMGTEQIQQLGASWTRNSFFSARTLLTDLLDSYKQDIETMLNPQRITRDGAQVTVGLDQAKAREQAKTLLQKLGYQPDPDKRGTIQDLSSDARINLVLETNKQVSQGEGWWAQGQDPAVLDMWPAQELFRAVEKKLRRDWVERWRRAGEATGDPIGTGWTITPDLKLIALKNHAIWDRLGDPGLFPDGLGNPYPPFAFNSGMDVRDVTRAVAEELGLITAGEIVQPRALQEVAA